MRRIATWVILTVMALLALLPTVAGAEGQQKVYVLHLDGFRQIDPGLAQYTKRVFLEAESDPAAAAVAIIIDTPGGAIDNALAMKNSIIDTKLPTVAFVQGGALSAGALIATAAEKLYMRPGSTIGAAEPRLAGTTERADYKTLSVVVKEFRGTATYRGRDADMAAAMVDVHAKVPGQREDLLVLTTDEAVASRYADGQATDLADALAQAGFAGYQVVDMQLTLSEEAGRLLTTPWVAILLLVVGVIAMGVEFMKPGVTVPALIGILSLGLFFMGNVLVGTAGWLELALALIGILLVVVEAFMPGFGIFGIAGVIAMGAAIFLSVPTTEQAISYLMFTAIAFLVALVGIVRTIGRRGLGKALTLETNEEGYLPGRADLAALVGMEGTALTVLRPAGTAQFGAEKVDVVTEGEYLPAGTPVTVVRVDGTRVVIRSVAK